MSGSIPDRIKNKAVEMYFAEENGEKLYTLKEIKKALNGTISIASIINYARDYANKNGLEMRRGTKTKPGSQKSYNDLTKEEEEEIIKKYQKTDERGRYEYLVNEILELEDIKRNVLYRVIKENNIKHRTRNKIGLDNENKLTLKEKLQIVLDYKLFLTKEEIKTMLDNINMFTYPAYNFFKRKYIKENIEDKETQEELLKLVEEIPVKEELQIEIRER